MARLRFGAGSISHNLATASGRAAKIAARKLLKSYQVNGEPGGARTRDHRIKSAMLYQLSYRLPFDRICLIEADAVKMPALSG